MKKLMARDNIGGRIQNWWFHYGNDGRKKITVETVQDVEPIFELVKRNSEHSSKDFRYRGSVPYTLMDEICKVKGKLWGMNTTEAYREIVQGKTDRAKKVWDTLLGDREYRKLQAV